MSGIAGLLRLDGRAVRPHDLERAANALRRHGPDRSDIFAGDNIGLVHVLMRMTPEDRFDRQPWRGASGALIVADLRLDNRDDVLASLGVSTADATAWPDSRVLLAAWDQFGDDVWPKLRGPFAAAIWCPRRRVLTLARDPLGLNVAMWHRGERFFAFSTMPSGLFALDVPRELSEEKLADFLVLNHADHATTIYRKVFRVLPAHVMRVTADGAVTQRRFWTPTEIKPMRLSSDEAYAEGLRDCLDRAVRRQMRSAHGIGSLLSGGLDSSSVSALAARALGEKDERLAAFTGVPRPGFAGILPAGHYGDETPYVQAIASRAGNIDVTYIHNNEHGDFTELERFFIALEGPVRNPTNLGWVLGLLRQARTQGRRVLLGGLYGNATISWSGWSQALTHLKHGRIVTAYRQWQLFYRHTSYSRAQALRKLFLAPLLPASRRASPTWRLHSAIRHDFAGAMGIDRRARRLRHDFHDRLRPDERMAALGPVDYAGDWQAAEKAVTGVEVRDPTADLDVISYCFGVPPEQYLVEGIDRSLIRRAMWGLLPEQVLTNRLSGLQAADWYEKLGGERHELARQLKELEQSPLVRRMIDLPRLTRAVETWPDRGWHRSDIFQEYNLALARGLAGGRFLRWFEGANEPRALTGNLT
jgi:asparagine synthase (glutamine-hydrolysing)